MVPLFKVYMAEDAPEQAARVLRSGYIGQGPEVEAFEDELQVFWESPVRPLTLNSGTTAISLALHLCGVGPGDEVISTPMTCTATNLPILHTGARIVWADVDPETGLIDPADVDRKVTTWTKAIVAVDWSGARCDYERLRSFGVPVIQDAAHNLLYALPGGDYTCYSFQAIKHLTTGDGGALLVPPEQYERARLLRWYGLDRTKGDSFRCSQDITEGGWKAHMNDVAAAIGRANLKKAGKMARTQGIHAFLLSQYLAGHPSMLLPPPDECSAWWLYTVRVQDPSGFIRHMEAHGIAASPVHRRNDALTCFAAFQSDLPGVTEFSSHEVAIPCGWWLTSDDLSHIVDAVWAWR